MNRIKTLIVEADTTFVGSEFHEFTKRTAKVDAESDALVCDLKNIPMWPL